MSSVQVYGGCQTCKQLLARLVQGCPASCWLLQGIQRSEICCNIRGAGKAMAAEARQQKYDRQLRIWGDHGQQFLESSSVCLVTADASGTEALKNLVLPGIGRFAILDGQRVGERDIANNFFLSSAHLGRSRAEAATSLLRELNPSVMGSFIDADPVHFAAANPDFFADFTVVIASQLDDDATKTFASLLETRRVPFLLLKTIGLVCSLRTYCPDHLVVESGSENVMDFLRIAEPWTELFEFCSAAGSQLVQLDDEHHAHTPFLVILVHALQQWRASHLGKAVPTSADERNELRAVVQSMRRSAAEENFVQAERHLAAACRLRHKSAELLEVLSHPLCSFEAAGSSFSLWPIVAAIKEFISGEGNVPCSGRLPDMVADSARYAALQELFRRKSSADLARIHEILQERCLVRPQPTSRSFSGLGGGSSNSLAINTSSTGLSSISLPRSSSSSSLIPPPGGSPAASAAAATAGSSSFSGSPGLRSTSSVGSSLSQLAQAAQEGSIRTDLVDWVFGHAAALQVVHCRSVVEEYADRPNTVRLMEAIRNFAQNDQGVFYPLLRACDIFHSRRGRYPESGDLDTVDLRGIMNQFLQDIGLPQAAALIPDELVSEMCRYSGTQLHSISAIVGGIAAQEIIKIVTRQRVPLKNTLIFNGIACASTVLEM